MIKTRIRGRGTKGWSNNPRLTEVELDRKDKEGESMEAHCHNCRNLGISTSQGRQQGREGRQYIWKSKQKIFNEMQKHPVYLGKARAKMTFRIGKTGSFHLGLPQALVVHSIMTFQQ